jgi:hypothetical protein
MEMRALQAFPNLHREHTRAYKVSAGASVSSGELNLLFRIEASRPELMNEIILAQARDRVARKDELWKETCFEAFIPHANGDAYLEFNGSPGGDWNLYSFKAYREGMSPVPVSANAWPRLISRTSGEKDLEIRWSLPMASIKQGFFSLGIGDIRFAPLGLTVVMNASAATTYWALQHDGIKPDFHLRSSFTYDSIRD